MSTQQRDEPGRRPNRATVIGGVAAVLAPLLLLAVIRLRPELDVLWENHPAHFWLVLGASAIATALGYVVMEASRRRLDARLFLISLAFMAGAGFLGLHALATPGVLVGPNAGFELATPIGLVIGSLFVAVSPIEFGAQASRRIMARSRLITAGLIGLMFLWAVISLAELPPLNDPLQRENLNGWQLVFAGVGALGYAAGALGYWRLYRRRQQRFVFAVAVAFGLLAVSIIVIAFAVNWRLSWWEWHILMLVAFALIAVAARQEWHEERFSALYLERTLEGAQEVSILFADLEGFTPYSERVEAGEVKQMLDTYFARVVPLMTELGGEVHQLIGDAVMVVFNKRGDQPDHALLAARAGLAFQQAASEIAAVYEDWPRFRVGVNSGQVVTGLLGERGHRKHGVIGDTVNLAARLESQAPVGEVVIGDGTYRRISDATLVEELPPLQVKGKSDPVTAYILRELAA